MAKAAGERRDRALLDRIDGQIGFQRKSWTVQRAGWAILFALVAAALAGLFGAGPLARAEASAPDGSVRVAYERFQRVDAPGEITVRVTDGLAGRDRLTVRIGPGLADLFAIERVVPEPEVARVGARGLEYEIALSPGATDAQIRIAVRPRAVGRAGGDIVVGEGEPARLAVFVYP